MGRGGNRVKRTRGRTWRRIAGAASARFGSGAFSIAQPASPDSDARDAMTPPDRIVREPWSLKTAATLRPGQNGTKQLVAEFGERLVAVRYREDPSGRKRYKTAEIIVAEMDWDPPPDPEDRVQIRVAWEEELRAKVKQAGGRWRPDTKTWELPFRAVADLGLEDRMVLMPDR
jgi:hypothetical protein